MEEYLDIVDENNIPTEEKRLRSEVHSLGLWHRTVHIYFFKQIGGEIQILVHLRAKNKDMYPNCWDTRFGGHLQAGQTLEDAVKSELMGEVGVDLDVRRLIKGEVRKRDNFPDREYTNVFYYNFEEDVSNLKFNDGEVQEIKWMKVDEIIESMGDNPAIWSGSKEGLIKAIGVLKNNLTLK